MGPDHDLEVDSRSEWLIRKWILMCRNWEGSIVNLSTPEAAGKICDV